MYSIRNKTRPIAYRQLATVHCAADYRSLFMRVPVYQTIYYYYC